MKLMGVVEDIVVLVTRMVVNGVVVVRGIREITKLPSFANFGEDREADLVVSYNVFI